MTNEDYIKNLKRLAQIEKTVKDPSFSLDKIDDLLEETKLLVEQCYNYTKGIKDKLEDLS